MQRARAIGVMLAVVLSLAAAAAAAPLVDMQGNPRSLDEFTGKGKWVVVMLWASDCHICNEEAGALNAFHEKHKDDTAVILGVSLDGWENRADAVAFMERHGVTFESLIADPLEGTALYSRLTGRPWIGTPTFLVYGRDGELLAQQVGAIETSIIEDFMASRDAARRN